MSLDDFKKLTHSCRQSMKSDGHLRNGLAQKLCDSMQSLCREYETLEVKLINQDREIESLNLSLKELRADLLTKVRAVLE